jgi:hypothetical protein
MVTLCTGFSLGSASDPNGSGCVCDTCGPAPWNQLAPEQREWCKAWVQRVRWDGLPEYQPMRKPTGWVS